jgi:hypothetical protein
MPSSGFQRFCFVFVVCGVLAAASVVAGGQAAQSADPLIGTWNLDVFKSTFTTGEPPLRRSITFEVVPEGIKQTMLTTRQGFNISETVRVEYTAKIDGADYPIINSGLSTVALKRIDATTFERTGKINGKPSETATMKLSRDGKMMTITTKGNSPAAGDYSRTEIFTKQ